MRGVFAVALTVVMVVGLAGCAKREPTPPPAQAGAPAAQGGKTGGGSPPPADSPLAKVQVGMSNREVEKILGPPTSENNYVTGKAFVPWYFGRDRARVGYFYKGMGRVVFMAGGGYSHSLTVQRVEYDPNEPGHPR